MDGQSEGQLIGCPQAEGLRRVQGGEKGFAFRIYMQHRESMLGFFRRVLREPADVADAMQELYLRLARQPDLERRCQNPKAYLFTVATNLVNDGLRRKYVQGLDLHVPLEHESLEASGPSPEEAESLRQQLRLVHHTCATLSDGERQAFFMHRVNRMTYREVSSELQVSERTVRRWVVQALSRLQDVLGRSS
ncbi:RNA polymerase sigma factor [Kineobactrum salinum]|uniref:RNA polymerase sigma factor n=1 Tax=Kineobactrum salinum TaxID=2708301 RepID=A0A6C0TXM1_9GAMM|nr:RNA polymerase sigma factor [Kineobactrum salinum]QIB64541.1 RNA polymerase sigma factor [Kineobactrum salinum]